VAVDTVGLLASVHTFWAYAVLIAGVIGLVGALGAWFGSLPPRETARRAGLIYVIAIDIQLLLGIVFWLVGGSVLFTSPGLRFEHPTTMVLAVVAAHAGQVLARRAKTPKASARIVAIAVAVSLVLVVLGVMRVTHAI
jgi:hypothetical protein